MNKLDPSASVLKELILIFGSWPFSNIQICKDVIGGPLQQNNGQQNDEHMARSQRCSPGVTTGSWTQCDGVENGHRWIGFC